MKAISAYKGYRGLYSVYPECLIVTVYKDGEPFGKVFGFSSNASEYEIEYEFRLNIDSFVSNRQKIYRDLKTRLAV